jgi:hypothetical protein
MWLVRLRDRNITNKISCDELSRHERIRCVLRDSYDNYFFLFLSEEKDPNKVQLEVRGILMDYVSESEEDRFVISPPKYLKDVVCPRY